MSGENGRDVPPSFLPEGRKSQNRGRTDVPPSFTPSTGRSGRKPHQSAASTQSGRVRVNGSPAQPVRRQPRRAGGSTRSAVHPDQQRLAGSSRSSGHYQQNAGYQSAAQYPPRRSSQTGYGYASAPQYPSYQSGRQPSGSWGAPSGSPAPVVARHRHHPGRIIARILVALLVVLLVLVAWFYIWTNGQLTHMNALSTATDDSARTWLILGSDSRADGTLDQSTKDVPGERTDSIMLLVRPQSGPAALISIPRDSYVEYKGTGEKINSVAEQNGWPALTSVVEEMTRLKVDHVVKVGFAGVKDVVDAMGGVELCYNRTVSDPFSGLDWKAGCHMADGTTALAFSRMRHGDPMGDLGRAARQRLVIQAVAKKVMSPSFVASGKMPATIKAGLKAVTVDEHSSPLTLAQMAVTFRSATGSGGITGMPVLTSMGTYIYPLGSCVTVDRTQTLDLFEQIKNGTHAAGVVGGLPQQ